MTTRPHRGFAWLAYYLVQAIMWLAAIGITITAIALTLTLLYIITGATP